MNTERLLAAFSMIGDDPDRIQQLRKLAIALAISGRLNAPATALEPVQILEAIERTKDGLIKRGLLPKQKKSSKVANGELPDAFTDPTRFSRLGSLARIERGQTGIQQAQPGPFALVVTAAKRATCDHYDFEGAAAIIPLVSSTGHGNASLNRLHYQDGKFALGTILAAVFPHDPDLISARFLFEYLSAFKDELLVSRMTGTANVTLSLGIISEVPIPLVCPEVQQIVDELMAICDQLEAAREEREAARDRLAAASLARLNAPDPATFTDDSRFALDALAALTTRPDQINQLRQAILKLALCGKLVPQDLNDETARELLIRIAHERARLAGVVREPSSEGRDKQRPADSQLPGSWEYVTVAEVAYLRSGVALTHDEEKGWGYIPYVKVSDLSLADNKWGITTSSRFVGPDRICDAIEVGSIVFPKRGGAIATNRKRLAKVSFVGDTNVMAMKPYIADIQPFVSMWFNSVDLWTLNSGTSVPQINNKDIYPLPLPLPPLAEQHRIVAKVDELMVLCDQLESSLVAAAATRRRLLDALIADALAPVEARDMELA